MIKVKIIRESLREELLDEAKEDDSWEKYWAENGSRQSAFQYLLNWIYGRKSVRGFGAPTAKEIMAKFKEDGPSFAPQRQNRIRFLDWATNMHQIGYRIKEIVDSLIIFEKFKNQLSQKDIKAYQSPNHLISTYKSDVVSKRAAKARKGRKKSEERASDIDRTVIYEDEHLFVIRPHHVEASCHYGRKTKWCIAQPGNEYFDDYTEKEGKSFYFIKDDRRKPDDQYAKVAVQVGITRDEEVVIEGYWDRYDNEDLPVENRVPKPISELDKFFGDEINDALAAIEKDAKYSPPEFGEAAKLDELDGEIYMGQFNRNNLTFSSDMEDYGDGPMIMINVRYDDSMSLEEIYDGEYSAQEIQAAIDDSDGVGDFLDQMREAIFELDWPLDLGPENGYELPQDIFDIRDGRIKIGFYYSTYYDEYSQSAREWMRDAVSEHEDMSDKWEFIREYIEEFLDGYFDSENVDAIRGMAGTISGLNNRLKNLDVTYDEDDLEINIVQRNPYKVPLKIRSFNMPVQGYSDNASVTHLASLYTRKIKSIMLPFERILASSLREVLDMITQSMSKQTKLKFKGFEPQELVKLDPKDVFVSVSKPSANSITGAAGFSAPEVRSTTGFSLTRRDDVEQIKNSPQYIVALDEAIDMVYERAFEKFDIDAANKELEGVYQELFVDNERIKNMKMDKGIEPTAYTESKKRRKFKVRILK